LVHVVDSYYFFNCVKVKANSGS
ncbi:unnamed protein product, partial [Allacma fusca]